MFITLQHEHSDRPFDSMNLWLEDVGKNEFYVCMRELMTFDGIHSDLKVVSRREWWGRSILKIWFRGIVFNKRADSIAHSQLFYLFIFLNLFICLLHLVTFFDNLIVCLLLFSWPLQHWFAYNELPAYWNFTERGKINFAGYGAPLRGNNYAFCQVRK